ncbi:hypothetical protein K3495_g4744 [Podosphaera aphanis]|nr:hypothetical protein K3495_g4744 [Podosphaera aphanis]
MGYLDLSKLLGGDHLIILCTLSQNGFCHIVPGLLDSGANGYAFIDDCLLKRIPLFLKRFISPPPYPISVKGYNGTRGTPITHYCFLNLTFDGRMHSFTPFLITSFGNHGLIFGRSWLSEHRVLLDASKRRLVWPSDSPPTISYACNNTITWRSMKNRIIIKLHQIDMERRDNAFNTDCKRSNKIIASIATILPRTTPKNAVRFAENLTTYISLTSDISFVPISVFPNKHPQSESNKFNVNPPNSTLNFSRPSPPLEPLPSHLHTAIEIALISAPGF